jgi:hypothetical protein
VLPLIAMRERMPTTDEKTVMFDLTYILGGARRAALSDTTSALSVVAGYACNQSRRAMTDRQVTRAGLFRDFKSDVDYPPQGGVSSTSAPG